MKSLIRTLLVLLPLIAAAQSQLPPCPAVGYKQNCFGNHNFWGVAYTGEFRDGKFHGQGTWVNKNGERYVGEWRNGERNGKGAVTLSNGRKYVGDWRDGKRNGQGIEYGPYGIVMQSGYWINGILAQVYALDLKSFPFNDVQVTDSMQSEASATPASHSGINQVPEYPVTNLTGDGQRDTPAADAVRRWQQELQQELEAEAREREARAARTAEGDRSQQERGQRPGAEKAERESLNTQAQERERLSIEAEAAKARQLELEQKLAAEARERERQTAEAENARRRQQELEQRLAAEARERERQAAEVEAVRRRQQELEAQLAALQSQSASRPPAQATAARNQRRVALVIGNAAYRFSPLENPVNDATDIDQTLRQLGFQTTLVRNATLVQMREATRRFADQLQSADVALIYFAGHGIESNRKNYMIPVNADLKFEYELDDQAYNAGQWLEMLESIKSSNSERVNIVILDACRNNSLIGARSLGRGLGRMDAPTGTFLAYSTAPGKVAADGARGQRNSPFTRHLLSVMKQPGLPIEEAFKEVRRNVSRETNGAQVPWESTSLTGFFTFQQVR